MSHVAYYASDFPLATGLKKTVVNVKWMTCSNKNDFSKHFFKAATKTGCCLGKALWVRQVLPAHLNALYRVLCNASPF